MSETKRLCKAIRPFIHFGTCYWWIFARWSLVEGVIYDRELVRFPWIPVICIDDGTCQPIQDLFTRY